MAFERIIEWAERTQRQPFKTTSHRVRNETH